MNLHVLRGERGGGRKQIRDTERKKWKKRKKGGGGREREGRKSGASPDVEKDYDFDESLHGYSFLAIRNKNSRFRGRPLPPTKGQRALASHPLVGPR